jgi:hypothetical protein
MATTKDDEDRPPTDIDEETLQREVWEDRRLIRLGIDPDGTPLEIWLQLKERAALIERKKASRRKSPR